MMKIMVAASALVLLSTAANAQSYNSRQSQQTRDYQRMQGATQRAFGTSNRPVQQRSTTTTTRSGSSGYRR